MDIRLGFIENNFSPTSLCIEFQKVTVPGWNIKGNFRQSSKTTSVFLEHGNIETWNIENGTFWKHGTNGSMKNGNMENVGKLETWKHENLNNWKLKTMQVKLKNKKQTIEDTFKKTTTTQINQNH